MRYIVTVGPDAEYFTRRGPAIKRFAELGGEGRGVSIRADVTLKSAEKERVKAIRDDIVLHARNLQRIFDSYDDIREKQRELVVKLDGTSQFDERYKADWVGYRCFTGSDRYKEYLDAKDARRKYFERYRVRANEI